MHLATGYPWVGDSRRFAVSENQGVAGLGLPPAHDAVDKTEERRAEIEQTRAALSEKVDASRERLGPEHVVEQARETVQATTKNRVGRARESLDPPFVSASVPTTVPIPAGQRSVDGDGKCGAGIERGFHEP